MAILFALLAFVLCLSCSHHYAVEGRLKIMQQKDIEMICVNIYKQPALNHPALKNHKIQKNPTFLYKYEKSKVSLIENTTIFENTIKCPKGMVPIQRHRNNMTSQFQGIHPLDQQQSYYHYALLETSDKYAYRGGRAVINIQNPGAQGSQYSMASIMLGAGPVESRESIGVGWAVNPTLYGDSKTHATGFWKVGDKGCYNTVCPGFVQVDQTNILGMPFNYISQPGGTQYVVEYMISQDRTTGHWWVTTDGIKIGYWPKELFTSLANGATPVQFGGSVTGSPESGLSPPMGNGKFPDGDYKSSCYMSEIKVIDSEYILRDISDKESYESVSNAKCYNLKNFFNAGPPLGFTFSFGGPGGMCGL